MPLNKISRADGRVEIICGHGVGHPTYDSAVKCAERYGEILPDNSNRDKVINAWLVHGCCGCCKNLVECRSDGIGLVWGKAPTSEW